MSDLKLTRVEPQPTFIESSGRWSWDLPDHCRYPGCSHNVVTASREWWEYAPSEAKPHPMAEGVMLRDGAWYWASPCDAHDERDRYRALLVDARADIASLPEGALGYDGDEGGYWPIRDEFLWRIDAALEGKQ